MRSSFKKAAYVHKHDPANLAAYKVGARVRHAQRGEGIVERREYSQTLGETIISYRVEEDLRSNCAADLELVPTCEFVLDERSNDQLTCGAPAPHLVHIEVNRDATFDYHFCDAHATEELALNDKLDPRGWHAYEVKELQEDFKCHA